jgi:hypothetical protein
MAKEPNPNYLQKTSIDYAICIRQSSQSRRLGSHCIVPATVSKMVIPEGFCAKAVEMQERAVWMH